MSAFLARLGGDLRTAVVGLGDAWRYLRARPVRGVRPRVGFDGAAEAILLTILLASLIAGSMILIDPLVPGLRARLPLSLIHFFERITDLGLGGVILWPIGLALLLVLAVKPQLDHMGRRVAAAAAARLGFLFLSIAGAGLVVLVGKYLLGRPRPYVLAALPGPHPQLTFDWFAMKASFASFPSGHSAVVFATALAFAALFPRARAILVALAALVASSRVVLGSHYPSDVLAGAGLAALFTLLTVKAFAARRLVFAVAEDGTVRPMTGLTPRRLTRLIPSAKPDSALEEARP